MCVCVCVCVCVADEYNPPDMNCKTSSGLERDITLAAAVLYMLNFA